MARSDGVWRRPLRRCLFVGLLLALQGSSSAEDAVPPEWAEWRAFGDLVGRLALYEGTAFTESLDVLLWGEPMGSLRLSGGPYNGAPGTATPDIRWYYQDELVLWRGADWEFRQERTSALLQPLRGERWTARSGRPASLLVWGRATPSDRFEMLSLDTRAPYDAQEVVDVESTQRRTWIENRPTGTSKPAPDEAQVVTLSAVVGLVKRWIAANLAHPDSNPLAPFAKARLRIPQLAARLDATISPPPDPGASSASTPPVARLLRTDLVVDLTVSEDGTLLTWEHRETSASGGRTMKLEFRIRDGSLTLGSIVESGAKPPIELVLRPRSGSMGPVYWESKDGPPLERSSFGKIRLLDRYRAKYPDPLPEGQSGTIEAEALLRQEATRAALMSLYALATADEDALLPNRNRSIFHWGYVFQLRKRKDVTDFAAFQSDQIKTLPKPQVLPDKDGRARISMLLEHAFRSGSLKVSRVKTDEPFEKPTGNPVAQETFLCEPEGHLAASLLAILPHLNDPRDLALRVVRFNGEFWFFYLPKANAGD